MPKYVIERGLPAAGELTDQALKDISSTSVGVLRDLGTGIQWVHSYVAGDKIYCVYNAEDAGIIERHAEAGGFPADVVAQVRATIDPTTAE